MASAYSEIRDDDSDSEKGLMGSESGPAGDGESRSPGQPPRKRDSAPLAYPEGGPLLMPYSPAYAESTYAVTGDLMAGFEDRYKNTPLPDWNTKGDADGGVLQTKYRTIAVDVQNILARKHSRNKQFFHLLGKVLLRLLSSMILAAAMIGTFKYYETIKVLSDFQKNVFNLLSTGIYLTMGLNLAGAFKGMATMLRWRLLARKPHSLIEVDLILGLSSLVKVFKLSIHSLKGGRFWVFLAGISWIFINCVGRVSVALTGLAYSYDSGNATGTAPGAVHIADMRYFWPSVEEVGDDEPTLGSQYQTAHLYGEFSSVMMTASEDEDAVFHEQDMKYDERTGEWVYHFKEYNPNQLSLYVPTNRSIRVSSTCHKYKILEGQDGLSEKVTFLNDTLNEQVTWDISDMGAGATIYAVPGKNSAARFKCPLGPRCNIVIGFQFHNKDDKTSTKSSASLFECQVNVGKVQNALIAEHELSDHSAWIAAGAIGLDGFTDDQKHNWMYHQYHKGTAFGQRNGGDVEAISRLVGRFATGVIGTMDIAGPKIESFGMQPWRGVLFKVDWNRTFGILFGICFVQLLLGILACIVSNTAIVKDDSYLSTARLLRPVVERLGPSGCALTGKDIAKTLKTKIVYGVRVDETGTRHHLDLGEDIPAARSSFPEGWYDGVEARERGDLERLVELARLMGLIDEEGENSRREVKAGKKVKVE